MLKALSCLPSEHDFRMVALAALICALGSILAMRLLARVRRNLGFRQLNLLFLAGLVAGSTVWTTHFTGMLGFLSPIERAFEPRLTFLSLALAIAFSWAGFLVVCLTRLGPAIEGGGALFGLGIAIMHYTGMMAYQVQGILVWDRGLVIASFVLAMGFGAIAANRISRPVTRLCKYGGALAMLLAIVTTHFTGMAAVTLIPQPDLAIPHQALSDSFMIGAIVFGIVMILAMAFSTYLIDLQASHEASESYKHLAMHDPLTGLANRHGLSKRLDDLLVGNADDTARVAILVIDLDRFKDVNDAHGHAAGDHMLRAIAQRLSENLQPGEFLARIGGDEFVAVKNNIFARNEAMQFANRLLERVVMPIAWQDQPMSVGCSIGYALFPEHGIDSERLCAHADLAMHVAKSMGSGQICAYESSMDEASRSRAELAIDLKLALSRGEFELYYQPQNDTKSGEIIGFEALLRWNHPHQGRVAPDAFIPLAEQTGVIVDIGDWVLHAACNSAAQWNKPYKIAVNVAPLQLSHHLPNRVAAALRESGLPPERLEIELTETGIIADRQHALQVVLALKNLGVTVAMDDFGTGYSSLSTLQAFPFDKIKIDKSFIQSIDASEHAAAIISATILLGRSLKIPVLAEGVENARHLEFLRGLECSSVQGYLFGKPMPVGDVTQLIGAPDTGPPALVPARSEPQSDRSGQAIGAAA